MIHPSYASRRLAAFGSALLLSCCVTIAAAAEIESVGPAGSQRVRIVGPLESGDRDKLHEFLGNGPNFPSGIIIDSEGGEIAASLAVGMLIRNAMLPVTAVGKCAGTCVLVWVAGIHRSARTTLDPAGLAENAAQIREYLHRMELDGETIDLLLAADSLSPQQAIDLLGAESRSHAARLTESCGALDEEQLEHWRAIQALAAVDSALNAMAQGMGGGQAMYVVDPETERRAAAARELAPDRRDGIKKRQADIVNCRADRVAEWRASGSR